MDAMLLALVDLGIIDRETAERIARSLNRDELRTYVERRTIDAFQRGLIGQQSRLIDIVRTGNEPTEAFWREEDRRLFEAVADDLRDVAQEAAIGTGIGAIDVTTWQRVDESLLAWVDEYYRSANFRSYGSVPNLNVFSRNEFANAYQRWQRGEISIAQGEGLPALIEEITPIFGPDRARRIGITEGTRIIAESRQTAAMENDAIQFMRLFTAADERVCPICGPMHNQTRPKAQRFYVHPTLGQVEGPPFHVNCRCGENEETSATIAVPSLYGPSLQYEFRGELPDA